MPDERILIVDDEEDVLDTYIQALSREGYQIQGTGNGFEAIEMVKEQDFDLLLTDIKMPGMSGIETYRAIKQYKPDIVGVAITGYGSMETAIEALELGMDDFLLKPFSLDKLSAAVSKALDKKRLERENVRLKALIPLFQLSQTFVTVTELNALLQQVLQVAVRETIASLGVLMLKDESSGDLEVCAVVIDSGAEPPNQEYKLGDSVAQQVMQSEQAVVWQARSDQEPFFALETVNAQATTAIALPLVVKGETIGILGLAKGRKGVAFARSDVELLSVLASQAAIAIQNARLFTSLRNAYEELKQLDRMKSEFLSTVSHELRSPLHSIGGYVQLLLSGKVEDKPTQQECLETMYRQTQHLTNMIDNLLDVSRMESAGLELQKTPVQIHKVVREVIAELQPLADAERITLTNQTSPELPLIPADPKRIRQVVQNLIHNAIKFTPKDGHVTISALESTDWLVISVQDDGIGIPSKAIKHLFERFYQVNGSTTRRFGGTGLGLYICKQIVAAHGGDIWVESEPGKGSTFSFSLPLQTATQ